MSFFNKLLASKRIKIWNEDLTKKIVRASWLRVISTFIGIIGSAITM